MDLLLCKKCRKVAAVLGRKCCENCLIKQRQRLAQSRKLLKEKNLCDSCHINQRRQNGVYCEECLEKQKLEREGWKADGKCIMCGKQSVPNRVRCEDCLVYGKQLGTKLRKQRQKEGLCIKCGKNLVVSPHVKCNDCLKSQSSSWFKLAASRKERGLCVNCEKIAIDKHRFCETCYLKNIAMKHTKLSANWQKLKDLFDSQGGKCVYTGEQLVLGKNADLDHRIPINHNGSNDMSNFQWILNIVNQMKWHYPEEEFLLAVKQIYEHKGLCAYERQLPFVRTECN